MLNFKIFEDIFVVYKHRVLTDSYALALGRASKNLLGRLLVGGSKYFFDRLGDGQVHANLLTGRQAGKFSDL